MNAHSKVQARKHRSIATYTALAVLSLVLAACGSGAGAGNGSGGAKVKFTLDFLYDGLHAPFFAAQEQGFYKDAGVDVEILQGSGSKISIQRVGQGQVPVGLADAATVLSALESTPDLKIKIVGALLRHDAQGVGVLQSSGISQAEDLSGKTLADSFGTSAGVALPAFFEGAGLDSSEVKLETVNPGAGNNLMYAGKVDGSLNYVQTFVNPPEPVNFIPFYKDGIDSYGTVIIANTDWLADNSDAMEKFIAASGEGLKAAMADPQEAGGYVGDAAERPADFYVAEIEALHDYWAVPEDKTFGEMEDANWTALGDALEIPGSELTSLYTNDYVK